MRRLEQLSLGRPEENEVLRIALSDTVIADALGISPLEVFQSPSMGIQEISHRCPAESRETVMSYVEEILDSDIIYHYIEMFRASPLSHTEMLEHIHAMTVYGGLGDQTYRLGDTQDLLRRRGLGAFYTPQRIAELICERTIGESLDVSISEAVRLRDHSILTSVLNAPIVDPACGPGTFLEETMRVYRRRYEAFCRAYENIESHEGSSTDRTLRTILSDEKSFMGHVAHNIYGVDIDAAAVEIASVRLALLSACPPHDIKWPFCLNLQHGDSLVSEFPVRHVRPEVDTIRRLIELREHARRVSEHQYRTRTCSQIRSIVTEIESSLPASSDIRRASEYLPPYENRFSLTWELAFPEVFFPPHGASSGFRYVVMNPPYDHLKLNRSEYFVGRTDAERTDHHHHLTSFEYAKRLERARVRFFRQSGHYSLGIKNVINLYRLMIERAIQISAPEGRLGFVVPSTILCDESAEALRREIINNYHVVSIDDLPESARAFPGVTQAVTVMCVDRSRRSTEVPLIAHRSADMDTNALDQVRIPVEDIRVVSGESLRIARTSIQGWSVLRHIHRWPRLHEQRWILNRRGELDLTLHKRSMTHEPTDTRLIRGCHISRYRVNFRPNDRECYVHREEFIKTLRGSSKADAIYATRIAGQQISNMSQRWRLKFALVQPGDVLGNSCNYLMLRRSSYTDLRDLMYLLGVMNSHLMNWRFRVTSTNNHVTNYDLDHLPLIPPDIDEPDLRELVAMVSEGAKRLSEEYSTVQDHEIDACVFRLYGLTTEQAEVVLREQGAEKKEIDEILGMMQDIP